MKRLPVIAVFVAVVALSASCAYWGLQLFKPQQRPIAAVPMQAAPEPLITAAKGLFGGDTAVAAPSNYQLRGVVASGVGRESVAIIAADGQPAKAYPVGSEVASGVRVQEVHAKHVVLAEGGVPKRVDLMQDAPGSGGAEMAPPMPMQQQAPPPVQQPQQPPAPPVVTPSMRPGVDMPPPTNVPPRQ
ncbi:type II secretion system protein N [Pseudoduganella namucuonensis]|uniref:General secretion pathway protein C n=1 Tax=Pseudoduganella namucuonensis TaxID=1035707 RepID=A0A1I7LKP0_9BURK|nr:type II secretion system protein N [Pseudoduganella namucuonensis]SFV10215.1 general secretion pathway protein C [Pseudoduganella namucuonensis]